MLNSLGVLWWPSNLLAFFLIFMDSRHWNILCWNIRGINASDKWDAVRQKIEESACSIVCLEESKRSSFDAAYIRNFAPRRFDNYVFSPSVGLMGGLLVLWNSSIFSGMVVESKQFAHHY